MKIFPAIDIKDKKCVRLVKGNFDNKTEYEMSPVDQAARYKDYGFKNLHIVDLDGALTGQTVNIDIIKEIASGKGPSSSIITVGYSGWFSGQLESELKENSWLTLPATPEIVFNTDLSSVWELSLNELGIKPSQISSNFGNA